MAYQTGLDGMPSMEVGVGMGGGERDVGYKASLDYEMGPWSELLP